MDRGNLVIYDLEGKIILQTGEASGDVLPHTYPSGIPYIELPYGTMKTKRLVSIDVSADPHEPIFEEIQREKTLEDRILELEEELKKYKNTILVE